MSDPDDEPEALDVYVRAFERAYSQHGSADLSAYLPPPDHSLHTAVLRELVRVDMEYAWERGCPRNLDDYRRHFPVLAHDREGLRQIAFEEYRLRHQAGEAPSTAEYLALYGVRLDPEVGRFRSLVASRFDPGHTLSRAFGLAPKDDSGRGTVPSLPEVGDEFLGFRLISELGRGSFAKVYLARQGDLADRPVVLKISADRFDESQTLAQLQHENIVPVYSRHREGRLRAVCMPYLGSVTLRDVVEDLKGLGALPESGRGLLGSLSKSSVRKSSAAIAFVPDDSSPSSPENSPPASAQGQEPTRGDETRAMLGRLTYVEAVVWMGSRLADGLAHAHERGILHRDMKPANILVTDDGRPMLLDFNLAEDLKRRGPGSDGDGDGRSQSAAIGGTLPYMAPEHLAAFRDGGPSVDARSDIFAFGVILFEMLTGRPPFPVRDGMRPDVIQAMIVDRQAVPPRLRPWNPAVSPAVEAVIRRCLEPDPAQRYDSARALGEDLQRHLANRPLKHTVDPSRRERGTKWLRRNRRSATMLAVLLVGLGFMAGLAAAESARSEYSGLLASQTALLQFNDRAATALNLVNTSRPDRDPARHSRGLEILADALAVFHVRDAGPIPWWNRPPADRLTASERDRLRAEIGELLLLMGESEASAAVLAADPSRREQLILAALQDNRRAEESFAIGPIPRSVWNQRTEWNTLLGNVPAAEAATRRGRDSPLIGAVDAAIQGSRLARGAQMRSREALPLLVIRRPPRPRSLSIVARAGQLPFPAPSRRPGRELLYRLHRPRPEDPGRLVQSRPAPLPPEEVRTGARRPSQGPDVAS